MLAVFLTAFLSGAEIAASIFFFYEYIKENGFPKMPIKSRKTPVNPLTQ